MAIRTDPVSGLKIFDTRASKASDKITGKGYSILHDESLTTLPQIQKEQSLMQRSKLNIASSRKREEVQQTIWIWLEISVCT